MTLAKVTIAALMFGGCSNLLDLRVQTEALCVPTLSQTFSGSSAPPGLPFPGTSTKMVMIDFSKPLEQIPGKKAGIEVDARLDQVFIRSMVTDLAFVKRVKVSLASGDPDTTLPPIYIGEYVKSGTAMPPIHELKIQSAYDSNVIKYLEGQPANLIFTATGTPPGDSFMADVEACVYVQSKADY